MDRCIDFVTGKITSLLGVSTSNSDSAHVSYTSAFTRLLLGLLAWVRGGRLCPARCPARPKSPANKRRR